MAGTPLDRCKAWVVQLADENEQLSHENARLAGFVAALAEHALTTWPDSSCGTGRPAGQMFTTTAHVEAINTLLAHCEAGQSVAEAADAYAAMFPGSTRLDGPAGRSSHAGPDGRPLPGKAR